MNQPAQQGHLYAYTFAENTPVIAMSHGHLITVRSIIDNGYGQKELGEAIATHAMYLDPLPMRYFGN
jgi:hypothetical protein